MRGLKHITWAFVALFSLPALAGGLQASYKGVPNLCDNRLTRPSTVIETCGARDAAGNLLDVKGSNLLVQSEDFGTTWAVTNASVTTNQECNPLDGALDVDLLNEDNTAADSHGVYQASVTRTSGEHYTTSVYVRAANRSWVYLYAETEADGAYFDVGNGTAGSTTGGTVASGIVPVAQGWYRCWFSWTATATGTQSHYVYAAEADNDITFDGLNQGSLYAWGAQVEHRRSLADAMRGPGPYIQTGANDKPAFDFTAVNAPVNVCGGVQDQTGNAICGQEFDGVTNFFNHSADAAFGVFDGDHTMTFVTERTDAGANGYSGLMDCGDLDSDGVYILQRSGDDGEYAAYYGKSGARSSVESITPAAGQYANDVHVVQLVRRDDVAVFCVDGVCGVPADLSGYGAYGNDAFQLASAANYEMDGRLFYFRLDEEALSPDRLAYELALLQGVGTNVTELGAMNVIVDGDMEAVGVGDWTAVNIAFLSKFNSDFGFPIHGGAQTLAVSYNGAQNPTARQTILTVGSTYRITGCAANISSLGTHYPTVKNGSNTIWSSFPPSDTYTCFDETFVATATTLDFYGGSLVPAPGTTIWDDIYVYEYDEQTATFSRSTTAYGQAGRLLERTPIDVPFVGGDGGGIRIEGQSTNMLEYSHDFSSWPTTSRATVPSCSEPDPAGGNRACILHEDDGAGVDHLVRSEITLSVTNTEPYVYSVYLKPINRDWAYIAAYGAANYSANAYVNMSNGTVGTKDAGTTVTVEPAANGFYRFSIYEDAVGTGSNVSVRVYTADGDGGRTHNGADQDSLYMYGAQFENLSFPSSLIDTGGSGPVTRTADDYTIDPHPEVGRRLLPELFDGSGVLTIEFDAKCDFSATADVGGAKYLIEIGGATGTASASRNRLTMFVSSTGRFQSWLYADDSDQHYVYTGVDPVDFSEWHTYKARFVFGDMTRLQQWVDGDASGNSYILNSGTADFDTTNGLIRVGQNVNGTVACGCRVRNLRISPSEF